MLALKNICFRLFFKSEIFLEIMKKVVIIGGGFAGAKIARELQRDFSVTLIDSKDYFEFTPGVLRSLVEKGHLPKVQVMHTLYLPRARVVQGHVAHVAPGHVVVGKEEIAFDYLVVCSGSGYSMPFKEADVLQATRGKDFVAYAERLEMAKSILIIGGGIVGVELAGEILWKYPGKRIAIVHSHGRLMQRGIYGASKYADEFLRKQGVEIIYNERIVKIGEGVFFTDKNRKINADIGFLCTGIKANSELLSKFNGVHDKGYVKVNSCLQLLGYDNIFVAGDVNNVREEKTAQNAEAQAEVVVKNIRNLERGKPLVAYESKPRVMVISLGKKHGILTRGDFVWAGSIPGWLKGAIERRVMRRYGG